MEKLFDILIIGGGPAGLTAAIYGCRFGLRVLIIEKLNLGGTVMLTDKVENYPGFPEGIKGKDLGVLFKTHSYVYGAEYVSDTIRSIKEEGDLFLLEGESDYYKGRTVIVATGTKPRTLGIPGEDKYIGKGVSFCAACDGYFFQGKDIAVIGGGDSAIGEAIYLAALCHNVYVIHRRDELKAVRVLEDEARKMGNVAFLWNSVPIKIIGDRGVEGLEIKNIKTGEITILSVKGVFIYIGEDPQTELLKGLINLDEHGYVITDESMKTNIPGILAVGDIRKKPLRQIVTAVSDGAVAAYTAYHYIKGV